MGYTQYLETIGDIIPPDEYQDYLNNYTKPLSKSLNIIKSHHPIDQFKKLVDSWGRTLSPTPFGETFNDIYYVQRNDHTIPLGKTILHLIGHYYLQEVAASFPGHIFTPKPSSLILDMSAAPGGKTIQIADTLRHCFPDQPSTIIANDIDSKRLKALQTNINRIGLNNVCLSKLDGKLRGSRHPETFDTVFIDAPCSGEGTCFKSSNALQHRQIKDIKQLAQLQQDLLQSAVDTCKIGGEIIYSTCTLNPWENEKNIATILQKNSGLRLVHIDTPHVSRGITNIQGKTILSPTQAENIVRLRPHRQHTGGFFVAKFLKQQHNNTTSSHYTHNRTYAKSVNHPQTPKTKHGNISILSHKEKDHITTYLQQTFGIDPKIIHNMFTTHILYEKHNEIYCLQTTHVKKLEQIGSIFQYGVSILKRTRISYRPIHNLAKLFGPFATKQIITLTDEQMHHYTLHQDITINTHIQGFVFIQRKHFVVSIGKITNGTLKNKFIKW